MTSSSSSSPSLTIILLCLIITTTIFPAFAPPIYFDGCHNPSREMGRKKGGGGEAMRGGPVISRFLSIVGIMED